MRRLFSVVATALVLAGSPATAGQSAAPAPSPPATASLRVRPLFQDRLVGIARRGQPFLQGPRDLDAFCAAVLRGAPTNLTPPTDSVATMRVIDAIYRTAGLALRPSR